MLKGNVMTVRKNRHGSSAGRIIYEFRIAGFITPLKNDIFTEYAVANQEDIMKCERCGGLKLIEHFYGTSTDVSAWMYHGVRCINCGSITALKMGEKNMHYMTPRHLASGVRAGARR
jgi:hypothetical protein